MFCISMNAYKMINFAQLKSKRYENRKIQGVALPQKERIGQEWKGSHHGPLCWMNFVNYLCRNMTWQETCLIWFHI